MQRNNLHCAGYRLNEQENERVWLHTLAWIHTLIMLTLVRLVRIKPPESKWFLMFPFGSRCSFGLHQVLKTKVFFVDSLIFKQLCKAAFKVFWVAKIKKLWSSYHWMGITFIRWSCTRQKTSGVYWRSHAISAVRFGLYPALKRGGFVRQFGFR